MILKDIVVDLTISAFALATLWRRDSTWLRWLTVLSSGSWVLFNIWALTYVARFGVGYAKDIANPVTYRDAFREGLIAAQQVVWRYQINLTVGSFVLFILALVSRSYRKDIS
jgi:hypothetical protein